MGLNCVQSCGQGVGLTQPPGPNLFPSNTLLAEPGQPYSQALLLSLKGETMSNNPKVEVLVRGKPVDFSFHALKNGGATIGLKQAALDTKASKTTKKAEPKATKKAESKLVDGVRFDGDNAIIRINGKDVATISKPKGDKPKKAWKSAINSNLWNDQGGKDDQAVWNLRVTAKDYDQM